MFTHGFVDYLFNASPQFGTLFWMILALLLVNDQVLNQRFLLQISEISMKRELVTDQGG